MLWAEILDNFFELWWLADQDLLSSTQRYTLTDTGERSACTVTSSVTIVAVVVAVCV